MENDIEVGTNHTSIVIKDDDTTIVTKDDDRDIVLEALKNSSKSKLPRCIFRVPRVLRRHNLKAYEPDIVSIGPLHPRGNHRFQAIEKLKHGYLQDLLLRMNISFETLIERTTMRFSDQMKLDGIIHIEFEKHARDFYAQPLDHHEDFIDMIILDGCFLVQMFRKFMHEEEMGLDDPIFNRDYTLQYLCHDLLLLENQIPWFVLECLYDLTKEYYPDDPSLRVLILTVLSSQRQLTHNCKSYLRHLNHSDHGGENEKQVLHILDLIRTSIVFSFKLDPSDKPFNIDSNIQLIPCATSLSEAGIKFKMSPPKCQSILNIEFKNGVITIPHLSIEELTESIFRNLIAFEQCCHGRSHKILSYAVLMDNLIGSSKDMQFLCDKKIIGNWLSAENGTEFFNKLYNDTVLNDFYFQGLCTQVYEKQTAMRRWKETFRRNYCSDPWKATSWVAACILLVLTVLQTAYTLKQYYGAPH